MYTKIFFSLYKPIKKGPKKNFFPQQRDPGNFFFLGVGLPEIFFSWRVASKKFFFPELEGREKFFFLDFLRARPQIINGRPLNSWFGWVPREIPISPDKCLEESCSEQHVI